MSVEREMLAWAAGFFEGEGCVSTGSGPERGIALVLVNTDLERLRLFAEIVGGGSIRERTHVARPGLKAQYQWQAYADHAICIFRSLEPWLGSRRRARFAEILAAREAYIADATRARDCEGCGESFAPRWNGQARRRRFCSSVCRERSRIRVRGADA